MRQLSERKMIDIFGTVMLVAGILIIAAGLYREITPSLLVLGAIPTIVGALALVRR